MARNYNGPTARILRLAQSSPGGVIRWREAEAEYVAGSRKAQRHAARRERNHCMWVKGVLDRYFVRVDGVKGHYMLRVKTYSEDPDSVRAIGEEWTVKERRVRLISTDDPWTRLQPGTLGKVICTDDIGTVHVKWDDGSTLGLVPGHDSWEEI